MKDEDYKRLIQRCGELAIKPTNESLTVSIARQEMTLWSGGNAEVTWAVSTSRRPPSCVQDSLGTPTGLHVIATKLGDGEPLGTVFRYRQSLGTLYWEMPAAEQEKALITTRILRLRGLEEGLNAGEGCDSHYRMIYIHGTNHEAAIGQPHSAGCIEMLNAEVLELYERVPEGTLVWIGF
ncbi:MAG: L,D-transpeptidase [Opitutaceae bacterium]